MERGFSSWGTVVLIPLDLCSINWIVMTKSNYSCNKQHSRFFTLFLTFIVL